jgi:hypothetical protein
MSHAEIWDDSALVDSWNEALEEYKVIIHGHMMSESTIDLFGSITTAYTHVVRKLRTSSTHTTGLHSRCEF